VGTVSHMRPRGLVSIALVAAVVGGAAVLLVSWAAGWLGGERRMVVFQQTATVASTSGSSRPQLGGTFNPARIYAQRSAGVVTIYSLFDSGPGARASQGSGFVVSDDGVILTNSHVITTAGGGSGDAQPALSVYVEFGDRDRVAARIVGWDVFDDVGVLRVDPKTHDLDPLPLGDSDRVAVGEPVAAIGSPFGNENSLTVGVVSATRRSIDSLTSRYTLADAIQVDAPINHGNSGGPLFDAEGQVIGINAQIRSNSGANEGVGFAVPINAARRSMEELLATGKVAYAYIGVTTEDLTPGIARRFGYPVTQGAVITSVETNSPAAQAGLRGGFEERQFNGESFTFGGDVIVSIDGRPVQTADDVVRAVTERLRPEQAVTFTVYRDGKQRQVRVTLGDRPENPRQGP
jgi:2-alkenal reductase